MDFLNQIKTAMRIKHSALDEAIEADIKAGMYDLARVGIQPYQDQESKKIKEDPLIKKAIELYCKGQEDFQGKGEKYERAYEKLRDALSLCGDYKQGGCDV